MPSQEEVNIKVEQVMKYAEQLIDIKYVWWTGCNDRDDFHYYDEPKDIMFVKKHGIACSGFVNLLMHKAGIVFPTSSYEHRGGTWFWYNHWEENGKLEEFDYTKKYPIGTLLYRRYRDVKDQGHFAVLHSYSTKQPDRLLYGNIIHAYADDEYSGRVGVTHLGTSHFNNYTLEEGYYEYVVLPKDWLF